MKPEQAQQMAKEAGFSHWGIFPVSGLKFLPEVRQMCMNGNCSKYNTTWSCPPACGPLEEIRDRAASYNWGLLVQTTWNMEDDFDVDAMVGAGSAQKRSFRMLCGRLSELEDVLPMGAGACTICKECTYPDAPCRFPEQMHPSMEAYGLMVSDVCELADMPYYYGPQTITYTSCVLFHRV